MILGDAPDQGPVVWATGIAGLLALSADLGHEVGGGEKGQALGLAYDAGDMPQLFADGLHIIPHGDGTVAIGSTSERVWEDAHSTDARLDALHQRALAVLPVLAGRAGGGALGRGAATGKLPRADVGGMAGTAGAFRGEWRVQDRLWHGAEGGRGDGRSGAGWARCDTRWVPGGSEPLGFRSLSDAMTLNLPLILRNACMIMARFWRWVGPFMRSILRRFYRDRRRYAVGLCCCFRLAR